MTTKISIDLGAGVTVTLEGDPLRVKVSPDDETASRLAGLASQLDRIERGVLTVSQTATEIAASLAAANDKLDQANAKLQAQDLKTNALAQLVVDLRDQLSGLQTQIDALSITPAEKQQLTDAAAALLAKATQIDAVLASEGAQLDSTLTPPA